MINVNKVFGFALNLNSLPQPCIFIVKLPENMLKKGGLSEMSV